MHVLIIPSETFGHSESPLYGIFQSHQANVLAENGMQIGVVSPQGRSLRYFKVFFKNLFKKTGANYKYSVIINRFWNIFPRVQWLEKFVFMAVGSIFFIMYVKRYGKPDIIHAHNVFYAGLLAQRLSLKYNIPYVLTEHNSHFMSDTISAKAIVDINKVMKSSACNLVVSNKLGEKLRSRIVNTSVKIEVLHNVIDPLFEKSSKILIPPPDDKFVFISIGALIERKNHKQLISAFHKYFSTESNVYLNIVGGGAMKAHLNDFIQDLNMQDKVKLLGELDRKNVLNKINASNCFVLPSLHETFGVALIEALILGRPIVGTDCGGPDEIIEPEVGVLVSVNNLDELGTAMKKIYQNRSSYGYKDISKYCIRRFGSKQFAEKIISIYKKAIY